MRSLAVLAAALLVACSTTPSAPDTSKADAAKQQAEAPAQTAFGTVEVPRDGKQFQPAVHKDQIPEGAWFCDMGDVHYARMTKGDGSCPVCGMELSEKE